MESSSPEDVAILARYLNLPLCPKNTALSLELSLFTIFRKSPLVPSPFYSLPYGTLCLRAVMVRLIDKNPFIKITQILLARQALYCTLTLCSFRPHCVLESSPPELPLPFPGMRRTLCKYSFVFIAPICFLNHLCNSNKQILLALLADNITVICLSHFLEKSAVPQNPYWGLQLLWEDAESFDGWNSVLERDHGFSQQLLK